MVISNADLGEILDACPNLTHLDLMGNKLTGIGALSDRFHAKKCRISSLNIHSKASQDQILAELAELLASRSSKPLRYVAVSGWVNAAERWTSFASALRDNRTLQLLFLPSASWKHQETLLSPMQVDFQSATGGLRLLLSSKIAFLSVIESHSKRASVSGSSSLGKLDSSIVVQVFAFAGIPISRTMVW